MLSNETIFVNSFFGIPLPDKKVLIPKVSSTVDAEVEFTPDKKNYKFIGYLILLKYFCVDYLITDWYHIGAGSLLYLFSFYYPHNLLDKQEPVAPVCLSVAHLHAHLFASFAPVCCGLPLGHV